MAAPIALVNHHLVSLILGHLSDMRYKERRQISPDHPVEFLEFRPSLVPSICVSKLWAEVGTSILWKRYPHLLAMRDMSKQRRQWYAYKAEQVFVSSPTPTSGEDLSYLGQLDWSNLKSLDLKVDWQQHGHSVRSMLHPDLEHIDLSAAELSDSTHSIDALLQLIFASCPNLRSIHFGSDALHAANQHQAQALLDLLENHSSIKNISILNAGISQKSLLFSRLVQRSNLEVLEIDLDPGPQLLPFLEDIKITSKLFLSLQRLHVMCYPEIALALPVLLPNIEDLSMDIARNPDQPLRSADIAILDALLAAATCCQNLKYLKIHIGLLATNFPSTKTLPVLQGTSLVNLAAACPSLMHIHLLASEPTAIDASDISAAQFEQFCKKAPRLTQLSLKLHPPSAMALEESALQSLGRECAQLELLRIKVALQVPNLAIDQDTSLSAETDGMSITKSTPRDPLFPNLVYLAIARPQTVLSIAAASTYATSSVLRSSSWTDSLVEEELVQSWAHSLLTQFPCLDVLEAWGDWTGQENESLNYFLPLEEPLASVWEFLSGIEQDLWDDGHFDAHNEPERWDDDLEVSVSVRGSGDWDKASLINEYPCITDSGYLETYEEEPEDMTTPIDGRQGWFTRAEDKLTTSS